MKVVVVLENLYIYFFSTLRLGIPFPFNDLYDPPDSDIVANSQKCQMNF